MRGGGKAVCLSIAKDIATIMGCCRPEALSERGWEAVCLSVAKDIITIIGCARPKARIERGRARRKGGRKQSL